MSAYTQNIGDVFHLRMTAFFHRICRKIDTSRAIRAELELDRRLQRRRRTFEEVTDGDPCKFRAETPPWSSAETRRSRRTRRASVPKREEIYLTVDCRVLLVHWEFPWRRGDPLNLEHRDRVKPARIVLRSAFAPADSRRFADRSTKPAVFSLD